jgi:Zn-dependent peptidase ImmA (M78 family)/DNA-binding XRE family transcriptional regulator
MSFDQELFSSKLRKYRNQRMVSPEEISRETGISSEILVALESGEKKPSGDEILILADYYQCDFKFFISNEKLAPFEQTETLYRMHGDSFSKEDRRVVQEFLFLCECEDFLLKLFSIQYAKLFKFTKTGNFFKKHGIKAAALLREHLEYSRIAIIKDIYDDFRSLGFHVFRRKLVNSDISGLYIKHPTAGKCILVNYSEDVYRQRFTVAHECGHAILDEDKDFVVSFNWDESNLVEVRANTFASEYLLPLDLLKTIPAYDSWDANKAIDYANRLKVSTTALAFALKGKDLVSDNAMETIKNSRVPPEKKNDPELPADLSPRSRERKEDLLKKGLSEYYVNLCLNAYDQGLISTGRLAEVLLVNEYDLGDMLESYGRKLKYGD